MPLKACPVLTLLHRKQHKISGQRLQEDADIQSMSGENGEQMSGQQVCSFVNPLSLNLFIPIFCSSKRATTPLSLCTAIRFPWRRVRWYHSTSCLVFPTFFSLSSLCQSVTLPPLPSYHSFPLALMCEEHQGEEPPPWGLLSIQGQRLTMHVRRRVSRFTSHVMFCKMECAPPQNLIVACGRGFCEIG